MRYILILLLLSSCSDRYRYFCQNPDNFGQPQCQKPICEFNQNCPEYLVAPVLGAKIEGTTTQTSVQPKGEANCR